MTVRRPRPWRVAGAVDGGTGTPSRGSELPATAVMLGGMATYIGEGVPNLRVKDVVGWLQRFPEDAIVYAGGEPPAIVVRDKDNRRHLSSLTAPEPPSPQ